MVDLSILFFSSLTNTHWTHLENPGVELHFHSDANFLSNLQVTEVTLHHPTGLIFRTTELQSNRAWDLLITFTLNTRTQYHDYYFTIMRLLFGEKKNTSSWIKEASGTSQSSIICTELFLWKQCPRVVCKTKNNSSLGKVKYVLI